MLISLYRLLQCRLDRFLERRLGGLNPARKSLAKHADRTEFHLSRRPIIATRAGALRPRVHGPKRPSAAIGAESNTTLHRVVRNRPARPLANCCSVAQAIASSFILAR